MNIIKIFITLHILLLALLNSSNLFYQYVLSFIIIIYTIKADIITDFIYLYVVLK